jgi:hypothetical protein
VGLFTVALVAACNGSVPDVRGIDFKVPSLTPSGEGSIHRIPSIDSKSLEDGDENSGQCESWATEIDTYNLRTGEFERLETCTSGGEIESIHTVGKQEPDRSGHYTTTYLYRDGHQVVWQFSYQPDAEDSAIVVYVGGSDAGESFAGEYRQIGGGSTQAIETWRLNEGIYQVEGVYKQNSGFSGTVTFDDPDTPQNPDWIANNQTASDGTLTQTVTTFLEHWRLNETVMLAPDGSYSYGFGFDDSRTEVSPDFRGSYLFDATGVGSGGYQQFYDDGSINTIEQDIASGGSFDQRWRFDDASTDQPIDQEGAVHFNSDGSGSGTIITHVVDGGTETCDLTVAADGSSSIDNCR